MRISDGVQDIPLAKRTSWLQIAAMQLTKQTNYALRILMYCAAREGTVRLADVAKFYGLSETFLHKVLLAARDAGFVTTMRGRAGGLKLARPAEDISVGDVVRAMEERIELADCFRADSGCPLEQSCGLNGALHRALDAFFDVLNDYTIADITDERANINVLATLEAMMKVPLGSKADLTPAI